MTESDAREPYKEDGYIDQLIEMSDRERDSE